MEEVFLGGGLCKWWQSQSLLEETFRQVYTVLATVYSSSASEGKATIARFDELHVPTL